MLSFIESSLDRPLNSFQPQQIHPVKGFAHQHVVNGRKPGSGSSEQRVGVVGRHLQRVRDRQHQPGRGRSQDLRKRKRSRHEGSDISGHLICLLIFE